MQGNGCLYEEVREQGSVVKERERSQRRRGTSGEARAAGEAVNENVLRVSLASWLPIVEATLQAFVLRQDRSMGVVL